MRNNIKGNNGNNYSFLTKKKLEKEYKELETLTAVANKYRCTLNTIRRYFKKYQIPFNIGRPTQIKLNVSKKQLQKDYKLLKSLDAIAKKYEVGKHIIRKYFKKYNIKYNFTTKIKCKDDLFSVDNEISMYLAGFLAADGNIQGLTNVLSLTSAKKDEQHLRNLFSYFKSNAMISERLPTISLTKTGKFIKNTGSFIFRIGSKQICDDLGNRFNVIPVKSLKLKFPKRLIKSPLVHHFIRGYFDGDGCASIIKRKTRQSVYITFSMKGTYNVLKTIQNILILNCQLNCVKIRKIKNIYELFYSGDRSASLIYEFLYEDAKIFLKRKKDILKLSKQFIGKTSIQKKSLLKSLP